MHNATARMSRMSDADNSLAEFLAIILQDTGIFNNITDDMIEEAKNDELLLS